MSHPFNFAWLSIFMLWLAGCASPSQRFDTVAAELRFSSQQIDGAGFVHRIFLNKAAQNSSPAQILHVYLDGDGTPWRNNFPTDDPTSRNPMILQMMAKDSAPAIMLGRPCYHGFNLAPACDRRFWTSHRYSQEVVDSMRNALQHWLSSHHYSTLILIGFSGGGVLASLMAPDMPQVRGLLTIASNLDVRGWSEMHGYSALSDSLDPMQQARLPSHIKQLHLAGMEDENVPPSIIEAYSRKQDQARYIQYHQQHGCCWETIWPQPLDLLD